MPVAISALGGELLEEAIIRVTYVTPKNWLLENMFLIRLALLKRTREIKIVLKF